MNKILDILREIHLYVEEIQEEIYKLHEEKEICTRRSILEPQVPPNFVCASQFRDRFMILSPSTIYRMIKKYKIKTFEFEGARYFDPKVMLKLIIDKKIPKHYDSLTRLKNLIPDLDDMVTRCLT